MDFQSSIEEIDEVTRKVKIVIPAATVDKEVESALTQLQRTAVIKGFRAGKAPRSLVETMHGSRVRYETAHRLINTSLGNLVKEKSIDIVGTPEIDLSSFAPEKDMEFTAQLSVFPSPEIDSYGDLQVTVAKQGVTDKQVADEVERLRKAKANVTKREDRTVAQTGDVVDLDLAVEYDGESGVRPEPLVVALGDGRLPKELEDGIVGMQIGESRVINAAQAAEQECSDPECDHTDHADANRRSARYTVKLNGLFERTLPEADDQFAAAVDPECKTILELRLKIRAAFEKSAKAASDSDAKAKIIDALVDRNQFKVPQALIDDELRSMIARSGLVAADKVDGVDLEPYRNELGEMALKRVRGAIVIDRIGQKESIKAEKEDIEREINELAARAQVSAEQARAYVTDKSRVVGFLMEITRTKVLDFLLSKANITYTDAVEEAA